MYLSPTLACPVIIYQTRFDDVQWLKKCRVMHEFNTEKYASNNYQYKEEIMKIVSLFRLSTLVLLTGCKTVDVAETHEHKDIDKLEKQSTVSYSSCIKQNVKEYASNKSASHTEVAEATVASCLPQLRTMCQYDTEKFSSGISNRYAREQWKLGKTEECISHRSSFMRNILIRDLVEHRK